MLSVGRQLGIHNRVIVCRRCAWKDLGNKLAATLIRPEWVIGYLYVYCCPLCLSPDLTYEGRLLPFRPRAEAGQGPPDSAAYARTGKSECGLNQDKK